MLQTFVSATESDRIIMLEKTNFNLSFLKTIVELVSDSSVLQINGATFTVRSQPAAPILPAVELLRQGEPVKSGPRIAQA